MEVVNIHQIEYSLIADFHMITNAKNEPFQYIDFQSSRLRER